jgi:retron-type reverse transcriptase
MRRHGNLWEKITAPENIRLAYTKAKRCKPRLRGVINFAKDPDANLEAIRASLLDKTFRTSPYHEKILYEPKKRTVYVLPFSPDRIVQHALMAPIIPIWEKLFIHDSYACIDGKGIHRGSARAMEFVRRNAYCLKCDISKFYPSMDHEILMQIIRRKIKCADTLWLLEDIVRSFPGGKNVPIGNFTSQWMGNLYMNELDQYAKHVLKIRDYIRYCDDFLFFHNDKAVLRDVSRKVEDFAGGVLKLRLSKSDLFPTSRGVDFLGYRHFKGYILLRKSTAKRVAKRLKNMQGLYEAGKITAEYCRSALASAYGWVRWANTHNYQQKVQLSELTEWANGECAKNSAATV